MLFKGNTREFLQLEELDLANCGIIEENVENSLTLIWFTSEGSELFIDNKLTRFGSNQIVCLTEFHKVEIHRFSSARMVRFNQPFYCIVEHDSEIGCKGLLFFGSSELPVISLPQSEHEKFDLLWNVFLSEMKLVDVLQIDMLQMMLKRLLILSTRLFKDQHKLDSMDTLQFDLLRQYNFLVEKHFRELSSVSDYADLLHRSPKTIANLFKKLGPKTPLQFIHERKLLEARRLLHYTDKSIKEISYEIGFDDLQSFSRFFKKNEGVSPSQFREGPRSGIIVNTTGNLV